MKLPKITNNDPLVARRISLHQSVIDLCDAYRDAYEIAHGEELSTTELLEHVLKQAIESDKVFMRTLKDKKKNTSQTSTLTTSATNQTTDQQPQQQSH